MATPSVRTVYTKPPLAPVDLLAHLVARGLSMPTSADGVAALRALERIDYYRLLSYMRPLQRTDAAGVRRFQPNVTIRDVLRLYEFDRRLRLLCMDAVEHVEVYLRAAIVSEIAVREGAHFYTDPACYTDARACSRFQNDVRDEQTRHPAIRHYHARYYAPPMPPVWVAMEAVTFGSLSRLYSTLRRPLRIAVAKRFGLDERVLASWLRAANGVRNIAAHHARLWNAHLHVNMPMAGRPLAHEFTSSKSTFFDRAVVLVTLTDRVAPEACWKARLVDLIGAYPEVDEARMGFPAGWRTRPFWKLARAARSRSRRVKRTASRIVSRRWRRSRC
jgi:abortive infection bacteriophage resistance protein